MTIRVEVATRMMYGGEWQALQAEDLHLLRRSARERKWPYFIVPRVNPENPRRPLYRRNTRDQVMMMRMHLLYREAIAGGVARHLSRQACEELALEWHQAETLGGGDPSLALAWFIRVSRQRSRNRTR
jgi:hypothetical protein